MEDTRRILETYRAWAVVGLSDKPERESYRVARFLRERGYRIVPVHPKLESWEGEKAYADLLSIPFPVEVVDLFRRSEDVPPHVDEAIRIGAKGVWMQLGIVNEPAAAKAREAGLFVVQDHCPAIETRRHWPNDDGPRW
jgi:uncharacterized protein